MSLIDLQNPIDWDHPHNKGLALHWLNLGAAGWSNQGQFSDITGKLANSGVFSNTNGVLHRGHVHRPGGRGYTRCSAILSWITGPNLQALNGATAVTMGAWCYRSVSNTLLWFGRDLAGLTTKVGWLLFSDGTAYFMCFDGSTTAVGNMPWTGVGWHFVTMVFDGSQPTNAERLKAYIDGVPQTLNFGGTTVPPAIPVDNAGVITLNRYDNNSSGNDVSYDDAFIHLRALSADEVKWRYIESQRDSPSYLKYASTDIQLNDPGIVTPVTWVPQTTVALPVVTIDPAPQFVFPLVAGTPASVKLPFMDIVPPPAQFAVPSLVPPHTVVPQPSLTIAAAPTLQVLTPLPIPSHTEVSPPSLTFGSPPLPIEPIPGAHRQIVVDQEPGGSNYPFLLPSDDLGQLIADFYLQYRDDACAVLLPLRITALWNFGTEGTDPTDDVHEYDLLIKDDNDNVVFDSRDVSDYRTSEWGTDKRILEWVNPATFEICRIVIWIAWPPEGAPITWPKYLEPEDARLDPRTYERRPLDVTSLVVDLNDGTHVNIPASSKIKFVAGYNYTITPTATQEVDGGALRNVIDLGVAPDAGLGRFPGCEDRPAAVHRINGSTGDAAGNISFDAVACYHTGLDVVSVAGGVVTVAPATMVLSNNCKPCYACEDFVLVYNALHRLYLKYKALGVRAEAARDLLAVNIARWEASRECRRGSVVRTSALALGACRAGLGFAVCNNTSQPLQNVNVTIKLKTTGPDGMCLVCNSVFRKGNVDPTSAAPPTQLLPYALGGTFPTAMTAHFDCISPGTLGTIVFQVEAINAGDSDTITMDVSPSAGIVATPKTQTISLRCSSVSNPLCCENKTTKPVTTKSATFSAQAIDAGNIAKLIPDPEGNVALVLPYGHYEHGLTDNDEVSISNTTMATYTGKHRVTRLYSPRVVILDTKFVGEATGGHWLKV